MIAMLLFNNYLNNLHHFFPNHPIFVSKSIFTIVLLMHEAKEDELILRLFVKDVIWLLDGISIRYKIDKLASAPLK